MTQTTPRGSHKFLSKRLSVRLLCLLAVVVLGVLGKTYLLSPLPRGAYPVLSTAQWMGSKPRNPYPYAWVSNGDLAYLTKDANGMPQVCYQKMDARGPVGAVRHGPELPVDTYCDFFFPSPDEQWVAYVRNSRPIHFQTFLLSADSKSRQTSGHWFSGWFTDSRSYVSIANGFPVLTQICHVDSPHTETVPGIAPGGELPIAVTTLASSPNFLIGGPFNSIVPNPATHRNYPLLTLRSFQAVRPGVVQQTWQATVPVVPQTRQFTPPNDMNFLDAAASPDNRYLLWTVGTLPSSRWSDWLGRLNANWHKDSRFDMHYFLTDLHGNNKRPVLTNIMGGTLTLAPTWTPDSKHLIDQSVKRRTYFMVGISVQQRTRKACRRQVLVERLG